jgi:hypothetical protein
MTQEFSADLVKVRRKDGKRETWAQFRFFDEPLPPPPPAPAVAPSTLAAQIRATPAGMATWAGTGPSGRTCGQCRHFNETAPRQGWCAEFARLMKGGGHWRPGAQAEKVAPRFSALTAACRRFSARR